MVNKIIFVKSGGFSHQEFSLSGNIHFSGPNGFGKTTLLKAVLFAYSGESEDLGNQWRNFLFPHVDSMILYEMGAGKNAFTLCVAKVDTSLEMLLVKGMYEQEIFMTGTHQPNSMSLILKNIKKRKLDYIDQLTNGEDYRKIIFGQEEGKNKSLYRKFILFEAQKADLIIESQRDMIRQNDWSVSVFKDRMAKLALSDSQRINISVVRESLKEFLKHWKSIERYRNNREMIPEIGLLRSQIEKYQSETKSLVRDLIVGFEDRKNALKALKKEIAELQKEKQQAISQSTLLKNNHIQLLESLLYQKVRFIHRIEQLTEKHHIYKSLDVQSLKASAACLPLLEEKKQEILSRIKGLEPKSKGQNPKDFLQYQEQLAQQELDNQRLSKREKIITESWQQLGQLEEISQQKIHELTRELNDLDKEIDGLKSKAFHIRREGIAELPGEQNSDRIIRLEEEFYRLSIEKERSQNRLTQLQNQKEIEGEEIARKEADAKDEHKEKVLKLSRQIEQSKSEISDLRGSFQDWLGKNYPDWEKTIGKICRPEVLRNPYLGPEIERLNELFFGIKLDLDEVEPAIRSNQDLQLQLRELENQLEVLSQNGLEIEGQFTKRKLNLEKRFRQKIRQEENELKKLNYEIEQIKIRLRQQKQAGNRKLNALIQEMEGKAISIDYQIQEKESIRQSLKQSLDQAFQDLSEKKMEVKEGVRSKLDSLEETHQKSKAALTTSIQKVESSVILKTRLEKLGEEALHLKLFECEEAIREAKANRDILREFSDYSDQEIDTCKTELELIELQISALSEKDDLAAKKRENQERDLEQELKRKTEELESLETVLAEVQALKKDPDFRRFFLTSEGESEETDHKKAKVKLIDLMGEIRENHQKILREEFALKKRVNHFVSLLGEENLMGLSVAEGKNYTELARLLEGFEEKSQIDSWEEQLAVRYADLVTEVANVTRPVLSYKSKMEAVFTELNQILKRFDFDSSFPRLQFSYVSSENPLDSVLAEIQQFAAQNANQLGAGTLFSQSENHQENRQAIDLLIALYQQLDIIHDEFLDSGMFFDLKLHFGDKAGAGHTTSVLNMSRGLARMYQILIHIGFIALVYQRANQTVNNFIQCGLDNLHEIELSRIEQLLDWAKGLSISMISASVSPVYLKNIDQGYRLSEKSVGMISAYQILSRAG